MTIPNVNTIINQQDPNQDPNKVSVLDQMGELVNSPALPAGTATVPVFTPLRPEELMQQQPINPLAYQVSPSPGTAVKAQLPFQTQPTGYTASAVVGQTPQVQAAQKQVTDSSKVQAQTAQTLEAFDAAGGIGQAVQAEVDPRSLVRYQYEQLMNFVPGEYPGWAAGAIREAEASMAARGVSASTMAGEAVSMAIMQAALPIAQQDAKLFETMTLANLTNKQQVAMLRASSLAQLDIQNLTNKQQAAVLNAQKFFDMDVSNLNNSQQAAMVNMQAITQTLLSDQAALNAAKQFNAANQQQHDQFFTNLASTISTQNAQMQTSMAQFNAQQADALAQFNSQLATTRDQFNISNQLVIDQSNTAWRRAINTADTAAVNAANAANVENLYNLSSSALANIWQQFRDEASWAFMISENNKNRAQNITMAAIERDFEFDFLDKQNKQVFFETLGQFAFNLLFGS